MIELILKVGGVALLASVKFMFAPITGLEANLSFLEVVVTCWIGGTVGFTVFFTSADFFMSKAKQKRLAAMENDQQVKVKKKFTRLNKLVVRIKMSKSGYISLMLLTPSLISIPLGSILIAKFYGSRKKVQTFSLFIACCGLMAIVITAISLGMYNMVHA